MISLLSEPSSGTYTFGSWFQGFCDSPNQPDNLGNLSPKAVLVDSGVKTFIYFFPIKTSYPPAVSR